MLATVVFFSGEPGGAEVLAPVIDFMEEIGRWRIEVIAKGLAIDRFENNGVLYKKTSVKEDVLRMLRDAEAGLVITSAASLVEIDATESDVWKICRQNNITTLALLDQWQNYSARFFPEGISVSQDDLPDYINAINAIGKADMVREGFPEERLITFGHPYLTRIARDYNHADKKEARKALGVSDNQQSISLFVSEPIAKYYDRTRGYNEEDALDIWLDWIGNREDSPIALVKCHPKEDPKKLQAILAGHPTAKASLIKQGISPFQCLVAADEVYGMTSIMLIEAYVMGKPVLSVQPSSSGVDQMVLSRLGYIRRATSLEELDVPIVVSHGAYNFEYKFNQPYFLQFLEEVLKNVDR